MTKATRVMYFAAGYAQFGWVVPRPLWQTPWPGLNIVLDNGATISNCREDDLRDIPWDYKP